MKNLLTIFVLLFTLYACNEGSSELDVISDESAEVYYSKQMGGASVPPPPPPPAPEIIDVREEKYVESTEMIVETDVNSPESNKTEKKIIKDGRIGLEVQHLEPTKQKIDSLVKATRGYYANDRFDDSQYASTFSLKIRIPSAQFENFIGALESYQGTVNYKEIKSRDVTLEFIDLETRLANKRKYLDRYGDLLKRANSVKDILQIENEVRQLEEEIESTVGRLKYLKDQVGYSTLDLVLTKKKEFKFDPEPQDSFFERFKQSLSNGWHAFVNFILLLFRLWPFWLFLPLLIYFIKRYKRRKK
jgi:hypothetical protein